MKLMVRLEMVSSSRNFDVFGFVLIFKGFETQRVIARLKLAMMEKVRVED